MLQWFPYLLIDYLYVSMAMRVFSEKIARWGIILFVALLPIFVIPGGAASVPQSKMLFATLMVGVVAIFWFIGLTSW